MGQKPQVRASGFRAAPAQEQEDERSVFSTLNHLNNFMEILTSQIKHRNQDKVVV